MLNASICTRHLSMHLQRNCLAFCQQAERSCCRCRAANAKLIDGPLSAAGCLMLQQGQAFWRGHDLKARETFIKENKQHWADSYREQRRQASKGTKASRKPNVR